MRFALLYWFLTLTTSLVFSRIQEPTYIPWQPRETKIPPTYEPWEARRTTVSPTVTQTKPKAIPYWEYPNGLVTAWKTVQFDDRIDTNQPKTRFRRAYDPSKSPFKEETSLLRWRPNNLQPMGQVFNKYQPSEE